MTPPISIAEKDELVRRTTAECLDHGHVLIYLALDLSTALGTVAQLQLALRHPANVGVSAGHIRKMITGIIQDVQMSGLPATAALLRLGDNPAYDKVVPR